MTKRLVYILGAGLSLLGLSASNRATAQNFIPAGNAFNSPGCSNSDLRAKWIKEERANPEWKPIVIDPSRPITELPLFSPTILEGWVSTPPPACNNPPGGGCEGADDQMRSEVSEEEIPWNHYTHDFTIKVVPDPAYQQLLSSWARYPGTEACPDGSLSDNCHWPDMEVEWDNGSMMKVNDDDDRTWGAVPEFVWPVVGDRVWVEGRWVFDCGHPLIPDEVPDAQLDQYVKFQTEIHPPRALVTFR
jgi:hypothetical protein